VESPLIIQLRIYFSEKSAFGSNESSHETDVSNNNNAEAKNDFFIIPPL
jgi:hypothetical protein